MPAPQPKRRPEDDFILGEALGKGAFGVVNLGISKESGQKFALKIMQRAKSRPEFLKNELEVLRLVGNHPNIVGFHGAYELEDEVTVVLELMQGGELFERLIKSGPYSEHDAREALFKVAKAIHFMHQKRVIHRDLKPENLLLTDDSDEADLKIADFGLSEVMKEGAQLKRVCGTWAYSAPEMAARVGYGLKFDTWSFGVIMFILLSGFHPFDPEGDYAPEQVKSLARQGLYNLNDPIWDTISAEAKDLVQRCIVVDPDARYDADQILHHPWMHHEELSQQPLSPTIDKQLEAFRISMRRKLKGAMEAAFAVQSMRRLSHNSGSKGGVAASGSAAAAETKAPTDGEIGATRVEEDSEEAGPPLRATAGAADGTPAAEAAAPAPEAAAAAEDG